MIHLSESFMLETLQHSSTD